MKVTAALSALAALAFAPLALGQTCANNNGANNAALLTPLTITQKVRTRARGGSQLKQSILVKNTGSTSIAGVAIRGGGLTDLTLSKASSKPAATYTSANSAVFGNNIVSGTAVTIPAGKTLKGTIVYRVATCPTVLTAQNLNAHVFVVGDNNANLASPNNCWKGATAASVTLLKRKTCP